MLKVKTKGDGAFIVNLVCRGLVIFALSSFFNVVVDFVLFGGVGHWILGLTMVMLAIALAMALAEIEQGAQ